MGQYNFSIMLLKTLTSLSLVSINTILAISPSSPELPPQWLSTGESDDDGCWLIPQEREDIESQTSRIVSTKWGDGLNAMDGNSMKHGTCLNESPSQCNWKFKYCMQTTVYDHTEHDVFAMQSEYYPDDWLNAGSAGSMSHSSPGGDVCEATNSYKWMVFYAACTDRWYLLSLSYLDWLKAGNAKTVTHSDCNVEDPYRSDGGCSNMRNFYFY